VRGVESGLADDGRFGGQGRDLDQGNRTAMGRAGGTLNRTMGCPGEATLARGATGNAGCWLPAHGG
jgi:hypothetical protein